MTMEEATHIATRMLSKGLVLGVSRWGDVVGEPTEERVTEVATLIMRGVIAETTYAEYR